MCAAALCWRGLGLQARVFYFVLQSTALLRVSLGRCERLLREQRTVGIATGECLLRVKLSLSGCPTNVFSHAPNPTKLCRLVSAK